MKRTTGFRLFQILMVVILLLTSTGQVAAAQQADTVIVRMFQEDYLQVAQLINPIRAIDYDSFVWLELAPADLAVLQNSGVNFFLEENAKLLVMNRFEFDPLLGEPEIPAEQQTSYGPGEEGFFVVQFFGPTKVEWLETLKSIGATVIQYQPNQAYIVLMTPEAAAEVEQQDFVRWVGVYHAAYRIAPSLLETEPSAPQQIIQNVDITIFNNGQVDETIGTIRGLGGELIQQFPANPDESLTSAIFALPFDAVVAVGQLNAVLWMNFILPEPGVDDEMSNQISVGNFTAANVPFVGYNAWLTTNGVNGSGVRIAIVDDGLDFDHPDLNIVAGVSYDGAVPAGNACDGHGTHVGGIAAGDASTGITDAGGFLWGLGMAPGSRLVAQNAMCAPTWPPGADPANPLNTGWQRLSRDSVLNGAVVSNNSWFNSPAGSGYTASAATHDRMVRDADFLSATIEPLIMVFSAGNVGSGASTITGPKEAKNLIVVANSRNFRAGNINTLWSTSSRGPALDGRILPTIAAPGAQIASARNDTGGLFCTSAPVPGAGAALYSFCTGTSMAAPHVTGGVALITQWWRTFNSGANPSPAMAKALLINGAVGMTDEDDIPATPDIPIPNNHEGWGRMNLSNVINPTLPVIYQDQTTVFTTSGQISSFVVSPADPTQPLKVTLVWSDASGAGSGGATAALVNDLDLTVTQGATTFLGNVFTGGWSTTGGMADRLNNIENVYIQSPTGAYTITVNATNITANGVPPFNIGDPPDQDFALVCTNCAFPADISITKSDAPDPVMPAGTLTYTLTATNNGPEDATNVIVTDTLPAGLTLVSVTSSQGTCSGTVTCNLGTLPSGATATITIVVTVDAATGCGATLPNTASIVSDVPDPDLTNNTASAATLVDCPADLSISKSASSTQVAAGNDITYTLTVKNHGPSDATGVTATDILPAGVTLVSVTTTQGTCDVTVTCNLGNLASGAIATITIVVTVDPVTPSGSITNTATVSGNETDPAPGNNEANVETRVLGLCAMLDDFNRPDGSLSSNWDGRIRGYRIRANQVVVRAGGPIYWQPDSYGPDQEACVTLTRINPRSRQHGLLLKVQELNNWRKGAILVSYNARSGNVDVKARDVSARRWILVGSLAPSIPVVDGDQLRAQAWSDGTVEVFINNISIGIADAGSFYVDKGGQIGLWFRNPLGDDDDGDDEDDRDDKYIQEDLLYEKLAGRRALLDDFGGGTLAAP